MVSKTNGAVDTEQVAVEDRHEGEDLNVLEGDLAEARRWLENLGGPINDDSK
jgi:hypothetical protein